MGLSIGTLFPLRWRLWFGRLLFRPLGPSTVRLSWHRVLKVPCDPTEVEAMQYVSLHTTIPVPRVYAIHTKDNYIYIEMAYVQGDTLTYAWSGLAVDQKDAIFADIKLYISHLRKLQPPTEDLVSSALQNPAYDCRIGYRFFGPLNHNDFHLLARGDLPIENVMQFLGKEVEKVHTACYRTHFTHADLAPRNIIVRNGRVVAIIDWAFSGWYPEYWEFTKAHYASPDEDWEEYLRLALPCYENELAAERVLWRKLPEPGTKSSSHRDGVWYENPGSEPSADWLNARVGRQLTDLWSLALAYCI